MMRLFRTILIVAIVTAFSAIPVFSGPPMKAGAQQGMRMLKASPQPPKEIQNAENEAKKQTPKPLERQLTKGELEQKIQNVPGERGKLNNAKANKRGDLRKASPQPPKEIQKAEIEAKKQMPKPLEKQLTKGELEQKLQIIPSEREKLQKIKRGYKPTSQSGAGGFSLSWLNPFHIQEAWASTFDVSLYSGNRFYSSSPYAYAYFRGLTNYVSYWNYQVLTNFGSYKGYFFTRFNAPTTGWYIIDVYASHKNRAKLSTYSSGGESIVATWDFASSTSFWNHYVTMQYLQAGGHTFYFRPEFNISSLMYVYRIRITSY